MLSKRQWKARIFLFQAIVQCFIGWSFSHNALIVDEFEFRCSVHKSAIHRFVHRPFIMHNQRSFTGAFSFKPKLRTKLFFAFKSLPLVPSLLNCFCLTVLISTRVWILRSIRILDDGIFRGASFAYLPCLLKNLWILESAHNHVLITKQTRGRSWKSVSQRATGGTAWKVLKQPLHDFKR